MVSCPLDQLNIQQGDDLLTLYQWNTHTARHYFCKTCGVYTFHQRRTDPSVYGVNIGCFDDVDGTRRSLGTEHATKTKRTWFSRKELPVLGVAPTGHSIHDIQLIAFHKSGLGVNVLLIDESGYPYGWDDLSQSTS